MTTTMTLTADEEARLRRWLSGDDRVDLGSIFADASAYPDISAAVRSVLLDAAGDALRTALADPDVTTGSELGSE